MDERSSLAGRIAAIASTSFERYNLGTAHALPTKPVHGMCRGPKVATLHRTVCGRAALRRMRATHSQSASWAVERKSGTSNSYRHL